MKLTYIIAGLVALAALTSVLTVAAFSIERDDQGNRLRDYACQQAQVTGQTYEKNLCLILSAA